MKRWGSRRAAVFLLAILSLAAMGFSMPKEALEEIRGLAIQHNGRVKPFDSFAREEMDRLTGSPRWKNQDPVEIVLSILLEPDRWQAEPLLAVPFAPLRHEMGLDRKETHLSYSRLVSERRLMRLLPPIVQKQQGGEKLSLPENEAMDLYGRFVALTLLFQQKLHLVPPADAGVSWSAIVEPEGYPQDQQRLIRQAWESFIAAARQGPPEKIRASAAELASVLKRSGRSAYPAGWRLRLEILANRLEPFKIARALYGAAFLVFLLAFLKGRRGVSAAGLGLAGAGFFFHAAGIGIRVVLGGRPPVSNFYETMLWLPFVAVGISLIFERIYRSGLLGLAAGFLAALTLTLADLVPLDPHISPVAAVLRSNLWLTVHVLTIVAGYGALALAAVLAHLHGIQVLFKGARSERLESLELFLYRSIQVGVVLLAAGIMLGAVWANASWGRYWGWDPKETWALITLLWFLAVLHGRFAGWLNGTSIALATIGGFFLLLMTYYGVSFYLVGLHSYAGGHAGPMPPLLVLYLAAELGFLSLVGLAAARGSRTAP